MRRSHADLSDIELARMIRASRKRPSPPREILYADGVLSWKPPQVSDGITHWRIYVDSDSDSYLRREVPFGQLFLQDNLEGENVFISSYNAALRTESIRVSYGSPITLTPPSSPVTIDEYTLSAGTTINTTVGSNGDLLCVIVRQAASGGPWTITWGVNFRPNLPPNTSIGNKPSQYTVFWFIAKGGLWWLLSQPVMYT